MKTTFLEMATDLPVRVRVSPRARRISLKIDDAEPVVQLVLPQRVSIAKGLAFLEAHRGWAARRLAAIPARVPFADGELVPVLGAPHRIRHVGGRVSTRIGDGEIRVGGHLPHLARRVRDALAERALAEVTSRSRALAARLGRKPGRISVRDTRSRWGSCAANGNLAFSWRLVLAPEPVLAYVVAHEVAHLVHMNHGPRFWRLVEELAPGSARQRAWLARHRGALLRYG